MSEKDLKRDIKDVCGRVKDLIYFANGRYDEEGYDWIGLEKTWWLLVQDSRSKAHPELFGNAMTFAEQVGLSDEDFHQAFGKRKFRSFFENHPMLCVYKFYATSVVTIMEMDEFGERYSSNKPVFASSSSLVSKTVMAALAYRKRAKKNYMESMKLKMMIDQEDSSGPTLLEAFEMVDNDKENCQSVSGKKPKASTDPSKVPFLESPVPELRDFDEIENMKMENYHSVRGGKRKESTELPRRLSFPPSTRSVLQEKDGIDDKNKENCHSARGKKQKTTDASPNISFQRAFSMFATTPSESNMKQTVESLENELKENDTPNILLHFTQVINNSLNPTATVNEELKMELYALAHKILQIKKQSIENASQLLTASSP